MCSSDLPAGGRVEIRLTRVDGHAQIRVTDTGEGIAADFLPYIFDRFRQADSTITRRHGGLGLGLAIVRHLAESIEAAVSVISRPGQGTCFTRVRTTARNRRFHIAYRVSAAMSQAVE